ncbi:ABC transporter substrate-binding protein [Methylomarinum vadi]|uniref:ABC transporter substrate-binding protein n=1 Tax=Methylomarinum vadi TaxID=438855 RepID=UPI0004DF3405|nr:ABC transporter substrate-binding protein [Methylomarinum vadi]
MINKMLKIYFTLAIILWSLVGNNVFAASGSENPSSARQVVEDFQQVLLAVMKQGKDLGFQGRYDKLDQTVRNSHYLYKISRLVVGPEWKKLSKEQQNQFVDVFTDYSISAYANNFKEFDGESFKYVSEEKTSQGGIVLHYLFQIPSERKDVKFDYMMKKNDEGWRILFIIADGVNDVALKRSEFSSIIEKQGFDALITKIKEKIDNYAKQS